MARASDPGRGGRPLGIALGIGVGIVLTASVSTAQTWQLGARAGASGERIPLELAQSRFVRGTTLPETTTDFAFRMRVFAEVEGRPTNRLGWVAGLDTGLFEASDQGVQLDRRPFKEQAAETLLLGRVQAELQVGKNGVLALRAGRYRPRVGAGAVFDAYAFGAEADVDFSLIDGPPIFARARVLLPDGTFTDRRKSSPLLDGHVGYRFSRYNRVKVVGSVFFDTGNQLVDPIRSALFRGFDDEFNQTVDALAGLPGIDRDTAAAFVLDWVNRNVAVETEGILGWTGVEAELGDTDYRLWVTALGAVGRLHVATAPTAERIANFLDDQPNADPGAIIERFTVARDVDVRALFAEIRTQLALDDAWRVGSFALLLTGDRGLRLGPLDDHPALGAFLGLSPLLPRTAVFFGGTFGPDQATPTAFSLAPDDAGILAAGAHVAASLDALYARLDVAVMRALIPSRFTGGSLYGVEVDVSAEVPLVDALSLFVDGGILFPGAFFADQDPAFQFVSGVTLFLGSD